MADRGHQFGDAHTAIAVTIALHARVDGVLAEGDTHASDQLVDGNAAVGVAIPDTLLRIDDRTRQYQRRNDPNDKPYPAVKAGTFHGDTATHLFGINAHVDPIANPELSTTGASPANPFITLDYACGSCHSDTVEGADAENPDFFVWATNALESNGGVHGEQ